MAKTKANAAASGGPWREGRPSFKAFYPEIIFLTIVTIAFIALAARLSCSGKKPTAENAPTPVSSATFDLTAQAFAQDASLDEQQETVDVAAAPVEEIADAAAAPVEEIADVAAAPVEEIADVAAAPVEEIADVAAPVEEIADVAAAPVEETVDAAAPKKEKSGLSAKILAIWIVCLGIPALLWIWRVWNWIVAVYGVKFEIRCDADNPKATTFLVTRGIFNKRTDSLHIAQIKDIQSSQTIWQKYFQGGVGTIRMYTQDLTDGLLEMKNMEEPSRVFNSLDELRRRYWALGGIGGFSGQSTSAAEVETADALENGVDAM